MQGRRVASRAIIIGAIGATMTMPAYGALAYGTQSVDSPDGQQAWGKGSLSVKFTTATNSASVKVKVLNGRPGYTDARFWNSAGNEIQVRSRDTSSNTYTDVTNRNTFGAPAQGPWSGAVKTCVNLLLKKDPCTRETSGRV